MDAYASYHAVATSTYRRTRIILIYVHLTQF